MSAMPVGLDKHVCVLGLGYIGLPTAAVLASRGYRVTGVDVHESVVKTINAGQTHIVEPELDILVRAAVQSGKLIAKGGPVEADVFIICVPTPLGKDTQADLSFVERAAQSLGPVLRPGNLVVLESTVPPGTTEMVAGILARNSKVAVGDIRLAHAPERVLPGRILREVVENDRIIGGIDDASTSACADFYSTFVSGELHLTTARTAETAKLVENAFRDVNIAFANELSVLADELDVDVWELIRLANKHPRVNILLPGPGVGGHCIAVDPWFLINAAGANCRLMRTARQVNEAKPDWVVERVMKRAERFKQPKIACLGLAYKPDIDDLRESPALKVVRELRDKKAGELRVVEPNLRTHDEFKLVSIEEALRGADIVLFLVSHRPFRRIAPNLLAEKTVIDTCGALRT